MVRTRHGAGFGAKPLTPLSLLHASGRDPVLPKESVRFTPD